MIIENWNPILGVSTQYDTTIGSINNRSEITIAIVIFKVTA